MILVLDQPPGLQVKDLLAKAGRNGAPQVRGPMIAGPFDPADQPLRTLHNGDKLHIVAAAGGDPAGLAERLDSLGFSPGVELRQIHLLIDNSGTGGESSFAERFSAELIRRCYQAAEIKAPCGCVRWDSRGKVFVLPAGGKTWLPSSPELNHYAGQAVQPKHLRSSRG